MKNITTADKIFKQALRYYNQGEFKRVIKLLNQGIKLFPQYARFYNTRGNAYRELGQYKKAIQNFNRAIKLNTKDAKFYYNRGGVYADLKQHKKASHDFNRAIKLNPKDGYGYYNRGITYYDLGEHKKAIGDYTKAIKLNAQNADAYTNRGIIYAEKGRYKKAIKDCTKVIELSPKSSDAYYNRGLTYDDLGQYKKAIKDFTKVIKLNPKYINAYYQITRIYLEMDKYKDVINALNKVIKLKPKDATAYNNRGYSYYKLGKWSNALADYNKTIKISPRCAVYYVSRAEIRLKKGDYKLAENDLRRAKPYLHKEPWDIKDIAKFLNKYIDLVKFTDAKGYNLPIPVIQMQSRHKPIDEIKSYIKQRTEPLFKKPLMRNINESEEPTEQFQQIIKPAQKTYCYLITEKGRRDLTQEQHKKLVREAEKKHPYDMFIDGTKPNYPCYKKCKNSKIEKNNLTIIEFEIIKEYIETGKAILPGATDSVKQYNKASKEAKEARGGRLDKEKIGDSTAQDYFEDARRKVDINLGPGKGFRAFKRGKEISISTSSDIFQFKPPPGLKYALIIPPPKPTISSNIHST